MDFSSQTHFKLVLKRTGANRARELLDQLGEIHTVASGRSSSSRIARIDSSSQSAGPEFCSETDESPIQRSRTQKDAVVFKRTGDISGSAFAFDARASCTNPRE